MADPLSFRQHVRRARRARGWSQRELAERIGHEKSVIARLEAGLRLPTYEQCVRLMAVLGLTPAEVFGIAEPETPVELLKGVVDLRPILEGCTPEGKKIAVRFLRELIDQIEVSLLDVPRP